MKATIKLNETEIKAALRDWCQQAKGITPSVVRLRVHKGYNSPPEQHEPDSVDAEIDIEV